MRKAQLLLLLTGILISCQQKTSVPSYTIEGTISGANSGSVVLHIESIGRTDTTTIKNGKFTFRGKLEEPVHCEIVISDAAGKRAFWLENSDIAFSAEIESLEEAIVDGSRLESDKQIYDSLLHLVDLKYNVDVMDAEYDAADEEGKKEILRLFELYEEEQVSTQRRFIKEHPASYLSPIILWDIDWSFESASEFDEYTELLDPSLDEFSYLIGIKEIFDQLRKVEPGQIAPDFTMNDIDDIPVTMSEICKESNYLLIDFWASNCGPCRVENPNIVSAFESFKGKGFNVIGVSTDTNKENWLSAIDMDGLIWINLCNFKKWNENEIVQLYALRQTSENVLLDSTGRILAKNIRGEKLLIKLQELMN